MHEGQGGSRETRLGYVLKGHIPGASYVPDANTNTSDTRYFSVGEKVYPSNIAVDLKKEKISFGVVACDTCNQTNPPTYYKSEVDFQFAKGYLETADVSKVEDTIGEVFAIDTSNSGTEAQQPAAQPEQPAAAQPAPAQTAPASIEFGQTIDQVVGALGQPEKTVDLGSKTDLRLQGLESHLRQRQGFGCAVASNTGGADIAVYVGDPAKGVHRIGWKRK